MHGGWGEDEGGGSLEQQQRVYGYPSKTACCYGSSREKNPRSMHCRENNCGDVLLTHLYCGDVLIIFTVATHDVSGSVSDLMMGNNPLSLNDEHER
mmetsp:Transcript_20932/g.28472  ORF Transcript_20932/g.28472 Transcript_20932/m.28472 type:complete len:96 (-) Transcript_20932:252-539(-)